MDSDLTSNRDGALEETIGLSQDVDTDNAQKEETAKQKYPGCFKKSAAFIIDQIIIVLVGTIVFFPFSKFIYSSYQHGWLPSFLLGGIYFAILESSVFKGQSLGKMIFSLKVISIEGKGISPLVSFGRYFLIILPFSNSAISYSLASTIGITNTFIGGIIFLVFVGILLSGNTLFMLFHPQKRGLHDIIYRTVVVPVSYEPTSPINNFTIKPVISGIIGLAILGFMFGNLFFKVGKNPDFSDITVLSDKIQKESSVRNISVSYRTLTFRGKQTMFSIDVHVPIPYDRFKDRDFINDISNELYPLVKRLNTNPKIDTITMVFYARKYFGLIAINKTIRNPRKLSEIILDSAEQQL
jgi:uncharacterized RDD family membrane protein YckC